MPKNQQQAREDNTRNYMSNNEQAYSCNFTNKLHGLAIFYTDSKGSVMRWSDGAERMFGFTSAEMLGCCCTRLFERMGKEDSNFSIYDTIKASDPNEYEGWAIRSNGSKFWASVEIAALDTEGDSDAVFGIVTYNRDRRKRIEESLKESEEKLRIILETIPNPVFAKNTNLRYTECNTAFETYNGLDRVNIIGASTQELFEKEKADIYQKSDIELLDFGGTQSYESMIRFHDGSDHNVIFRKSVYTDSQGNPTGIVGLIEDITERKKEEEEVKRISRIHRLILDNSILGIALIRNRIFEWTNQRIAEMAILPIEKLQGASTRIFFPSDEIYEQLGKEAYPIIDAGEKYESTLQLRRYDGTHFWCRFIGKAITPGNPEEGTLWMFEDISEKMKSQEEHRRISQLHDLILNNSTLGIVFLRNRAYEWANQRTGELFMRPLEQIQGASTRQIFPSEESFIQFGELVYPIVEKDQRVDINYQLMRSDGSLFWCRIMGRAIDPKRPHDGSIWFYEDITERLKSEEMLHVFQMFVENSGQGFGIATLDGVTTYKNPALRRMIEHAETGTAHNNSIECSYSPSIQEQIKREILPSVIKNGQWMGELTHTNAQGEEFPTFESIFLIRDKDGKPLYIGDVITDITERKRNEEIIKEEQANLISLIENTSDRIWSVDRNLMLKTANSNFLRDFHTIFGKQLHVGDYMQEYVSEAYKETWNSRYEKVLRGEQFQVIDEFSVNEFPNFLEIAFNPIIIGKNIVGATCFAKDITQQKHAEKALKESRARLLSLIENTEESIWSVDDSYTITTYNNRFKDRIANMFGLNVEVGANIASLPDSFRQIWKGRIAKVLQGEKFTAVDRFHENNTTVYIEELLCPIIVENKITGVTCFSRNITKRKLVEEALIKSKSQLALAMELSKMCSWEYDVQTELFLLDDRFYAIYANSAADQSGRITVDLFLQRFVYPDDRHIVPHEINLALTSTAPTFSNQLEYRLVRTDGKIRHIVVRYTTIKDREGHTVKLLGALQDVTERKENEIKLKELNASKDKLFSIIAHDLRSPFTSLIGFSELLKMDISDKNYSQLDLYAESLHSVSTQTYNLLENLLEWAYSQQGGIKFSPKVINLQEQVTEVLGLLSEIASKKSISISTSISNQISVNADIDMLKTILRNLISNAIKFTFPNGSVRIEATANNSTVTVSVMDSGTGMSPETLETLFRIDSNHSTPGTGNEKGTGLGLLLCKDFIEKQGGTIWVESEPGKGSIFSFTLPLPLHQTQSY